MEIFYTVKEIADKLKTTEYNIRELLKDGKLQGFKLGKSWRIKESDLREFVK